MTGLAASALALAVSLTAQGDTRPMNCLDIADEIVAERMLPIAVTPPARRLLTTGVPVFVTITFRGSTAASSSTTVRLLEWDSLRTEFLFTRNGMYLVSLSSAPAFAWPRGDTTGAPVAGCAQQAVTVAHRETTEFPGVRAHGWTGLRLVTSVEVEGGASVFYRRFGLAGTLSLTTFGDPINRWVPGVDARWRGARGYLGAGVRYFHRQEADHERIRPVVVAGQELPPLKGLPAWFVLDIRADQYRKQFWRGLDVSFGLRLDLTGNRP